MVLAALVCCVGTWGWTSRVLIPHQVAYDAARGWPRGNFSDLYPRWVGARELLLHGRDPYSVEVTHEIQIGYYGRVLDRPGDPIDQQGFAYPVYIVFGLAPTVGMPFAVVQRAFFSILVGVTVGGTLLWMRAVRWKPGIAVETSVLLLTFGSLGVMQGLKLQQLSVLVAGIIGLGVFLLVKGQWIGAGVILAVATVKPQLMVLLLVWLVIWTVGDLRGRYLWCVSFVGTMIGLFAASEWYLPHWIARFWNAAHEYRRYADSVGVMEKLVGPWGGRGFELLALGVTLALCWRGRRERSDSAKFVYTTAMVLAATVLLAPTSALYNHVLLVPAVIVLAQNWRKLVQGSRAQRLLAAITAGAILWVWVATAVLTGLTFIVPRGLVAGAWAMPLWTVLLVPVAVTAMMLIHEWQGTFGRSWEASAS